MRRTADNGYERLVEKARASHEQGRATADITQDDIGLARLYSYAYRTHTIGAFHATRREIESCRSDDPLIRAHLQRASEQLTDLANQGTEPVPDDFRVVISTFWRYDRGVCRVMDALDQARGAGGGPGLDRVSERFSEAMSRIASGNGIDPTRDTEVRPQASFVVPNLGITIAPLVYGDQHSWNLAFLSTEHLDVPMHRHRFGVEIHLGYEPVAGLMILGGCKSPVTEGYALPIPPLTRHGWANTSGQVHHVPFIFGSLVHAGWGVFLDVEPQPVELEDLETVDRTDWQMSHTVFLEREIEAATALRGSRRWTLIPATVTARNGTGGLELSLARVNESGLELPVERFRIVSVVRGAGVVRIGPAERAVARHDHFGIPSGMGASIRQEGREPLVLLDALIKT